MLFTFRMGFGQFPLCIGLETHDVFGLLVWFLASWAVLECCFFRVRGILCGRFPSIEGEMDVVGVDLSPIEVEYDVSGVSWKCRWGVDGAPLLGCKDVDADVLADSCVSPIEVESWLLGKFLSVWHILKHMVFGAMIKPTVVEGAQKNPMFFVSCRDRLDASSFQGPSLANVGFWLALVFVALCGPTNLLQVEGA